MNANCTNKTRTLLNDELDLPLSMRLGWHLRNRLVSGCYPYDPFYKSLPEAEKLRQIKRKAGGGTGT
jgi:hypothetical protein